MGRCLFYCQDRTQLSLLRRSGGAPAPARAGGHGSGCEQMSPLSPFAAFFGSENGYYQCFIKTPMHWANEDCWKRLLNEARRAENRSRRPRRGGVLGEGAAIHTTSEALQWCKQDQILKTKTQTKITRPRPLHTKPRPRPKEQDQAHRK